EVRQRGRARERHRRRRLRIRHVRGVGRDPPERRLGQVRRAGRRGSDRDEAALGPRAPRGLRAGMQRFIIGRVIQSIVSMFVVSVVVFALVRLSGDPIQIMMPAEASKADIELVRAHLGLDRPWTVQYWRFLTQALQGDFGRSVRFRRPALDLVTERYGATLELGGLAVFIVIAVALPVGVYSAVRRGSALDYAARAFAALGQAVPPFWLGLVLVLIFGVLLHLLPTSGRRTPLHVLLPGITLGWFAVAGLMRLTRS